MFNTNSVKVIMSVRQKYKLVAVQNEIEEFQQFIDEQRFDEAVDFFRENLEKPTLFGLETSLIRAELLQKIEVDKISNDEDKCFVLYALALTLNLTGGYPNEAIPLYENHDRLAEKIGDYKSLSLSLGHHAKALRQVGRFYESEQVALKGLEIIRDRKDYLREAVNLYWLGMGLAHRGEAELSEVALQRSLRIFKAKFETQAEGVVNAFLAQRALWLGLYEKALECATKAEEIGKSLEENENHADLHGAVKILTAAVRMKGEALVFLGEVKEGEKLLQNALKRAREIEFVEEELPALRALALKAKKERKFKEAREYLKQTWHLAERGQFLLYNADSYNILAQIELERENFKEAVKAAEIAYKLSWCDSEPFAYKRGLTDSRGILIQLNAEIPKMLKRQIKHIPKLDISIINPDDEFSN